MAKKDRDLEEIISFCREFRHETEDMVGCVDSISSINNSAKGILRDDIGNRNTDRVDEFCNKMKSILYSGEEQILILEKKYRAELDEAEQLRGRCR